VIDAIIRTPWLFLRRIVFHRRPLGNSREAARVVMTDRNQALTDDGRQIFRDRPMEF
jgi:hypothetical protein